MKNNDKIIIGLDPSFTRTGICIINLSKKQIYFETASCKIGEKQFENVVHAAQSIIRQLQEIFIKYCPNDDYDLIFEAPLPIRKLLAVTLVRPVPPLLTGTVPYRY